MTGRIILAGSASAATRGQIAAFGGERHILDPRELARDGRALDRVRDALAARDDRRAPVLVHSSADVAAAQRELGAERAARLLEDALADLAAFAVHELGYSHLLVAGGETSGAVTGAPRNQQAADRRAGGPRRAVGGRRAARARATSARSPSS